MVSLTSIFGGGESSGSSTPAATSASSFRADPTATTYAPLADRTHPDVPAPQVSARIPMGTVAARTAQDMEAARARAVGQFDPRLIEEVLRDGRVDNESRKKVVETLKADPEFADWKIKMAHLSREEKMKHSHHAARRILEIAERDDWDGQLAIEAAINLDLQSPLSLHWVAFVPVIMGQGDNDQINRWGEAAMNHQILGCYLQTELGHGTNVQALETLATYDPQADEFVVHSPTLTSTKWWAGGAGLTATHAVVQCQLIIHGKNYGPHLFFVPLRSVQDGSLLPGIVAGDIGPKAYGGFGGLDNGWVRFDQVRIPRTNMLAKNAKVKKGGDYVRPPSNKLAYGGMVFIRSQMIDRAGFMLSRAVTIALRYSTVRRQFRDPDSTDANEPERSVLSYPSLNRRLVPILAKSYAYILAGRRMRSLYEDMAEQLDKGNIELLADVHVASSSLKAYCTKQVVDAIEECRQALGGHGFLSYAGFDGVFPEQLPSVTYEGDNYVLFQQVGRALLKLSGELRADRAAKTTSTTSYVAALHYADAIAFSPPESAAAWRDARNFTAALKLRAARLVADLEHERDQGGRRFVDLSWECVEVGKSHAEVVVSEWFAEAIHDARDQLGAQQVSWVGKLVALNALTSIERNITPLALPLGGQGGLKAYKPGQAILTAESVRALEAAIRELVEELLPQVIGLSDGFGWSDWELSSALGRKDGRVYEHLMALAEGNPLNHKLAKNPADVKYNFDPKALHGKHVPEWYAQELRPLFAAAQARASTPVRGNGAKL